MVDDLTLAREAQLMYTRSQGFSPVGNNLVTWRGEIRNERYRDQSFTFEIFLPEFFPNVPPVVRAITPVKHPNVDEKGFVAMRILENWRAEFHLYQVINALQGLMARAPPVPSDVKYPSIAVQPAPVTEAVPAETPSTTSVAAPSTMGADQIQEIAVLKQELDRLRGEISSRDEDLAHERARKAFGIPDESEEEIPTQPMEIDPITRLESEEIALSDLLASLQQKYDAGDVSFTEFARLHRKYSRELYLIQKRLQYAKSQGGK